MRIRLFVETGAWKDLFNRFLFYHEGGKIEYAA